MNVNNQAYRTIWLSGEDDTIVKIINQQLLPHNFEIMDLKTVDDFRLAIKDMYVRGAGLIGATAGFGMYIATLEAEDDNINNYTNKVSDILKATRPTASNLAWAVDRVQSVINGVDDVAQKRFLAKQEAIAIANEDAESCRRIGEYGKEIIKQISQKKSGETVNILTHCNAGWLAFVDYGSATSPIYAAHDAGIDLHVWVDETRPRNQGASLTAWELAQHGVKHSLIADNVGGHLMQHGLVDMVIVGTDRTTRSGDVANKIGTYLKALAAKDNHIPFYVALPSSTFDFKITNGLTQIPIEERSADEVRFITGKTECGTRQTIQICPDKTPARNWGFDVTPARLVTKLICERGVCDATEESILKLFPEQK